MLDLSLGLMLFVAIVFLVILKFLNESLYEPLLNFMDNRKRSIDKDLEDAKKNSSDTASYMNEREVILAEARKEASKIREAAINQAKMSASIDVDAKRVELENEYESFVSELATKKTDLKNSLLAKLPLYKEGIKIKLSQL